MENKWKPYGVARFWNEDCIYCSGAGKRRKCRVCNVRDCRDWEWRPCQWYKPNKDYYLNGKPRRGGIL